MILTSLCCTIDATGISAPAYSDILETLTAKYTGIFGADAYLEPDSQDGQWLAVIASGFNDMNAKMIAVFNGFSPASAQGAGLSSVVKINGLARQVPSNSTVDVTLIGTAGTTITNGVVGDDFSFQWALPPSVTIPDAGQVIVTATCTTEGAINAGAGTVDRMVTPTRGWQSVTNAAAATPGAPVESDAALRRRQAVSTALPAESMRESLEGAIENLSGVQQQKTYENKTAGTDGNGIPSHSICVVVEGGDAVEIATTIALKKGQGVGTYGTTTEIVIDSKGVPDQISFFRPTAVRLIAAISVKAKTGYVSTTGAAMLQAMSDYVAGLEIGDEVDISKVEGAANLCNNALSKTFNIASVQMARFGGSPAETDQAMAFNELAGLVVADIVLTVT